MQESPLTVLVVDDELPLREELRLFPWSTCNAELVGEAENGEEAMELCRKLVPDVVITDITMPIMDGIELFRSLKKEFPLTQVILLTCHSDFEYVRDALRLGALEYLIKVSLLDSDLEQALNKARATIQREHSYKRSELDKQRWQLVKIWNRYGNEQLSIEAVSMNVKDELRHVLKEWQLNFPLWFTRLHIHAKAEDEMYVHHELQAIFSEWEQCSKVPNRWIQLDKSDYVIFKNECKENELSNRKQAGLILNDLQTALEQRLSFLSEAVRLYATLSGDISNESEMFGALRQTVIAPESAFYDHSGTIYDHALVSKQAADSMEDHIKQVHTEQFRSALAVSQEHLVRHVREEFTVWACSNRPNPDELKAWLIYKHKELMKDAGYMADDKGQQRLSQARTLAELTTSFTRELEAAVGMKSKCRKEVQHAKKLIAELLMEPITLTSIAESVGLSSYYLSRLFREEVGESFNEYVTSLRMDKAIHLLQTTNMKVYEVAEQVGIPSYRYFSVLFRNRTGVAPTDFKKCY
ncbi:two-component system, response regulator YesN [Paenibacillus sp. 1_12]|uniref:response regulator transcription factor n=1 Tax=Paenibacillus sp. 1_12 TaxID=1566278 RepID=UPI0008EE6B98|nr:response regulator [Paenibacillus sp. 1_12]SFL82750.1 two-component system, response regulator YesN [Paenibacillus sp. 1_12]